MIDLGLFEKCAKACCGRISRSLAGAAQSYIASMGMEFHVENLNSLCRVGGCKLPSVRSGRKSTTYLAQDYAPELKKIFMIDVSADKENVHPKYFCAACKTAMQDYKSSADSAVTKCSGGCGQGKLVVWEPHKRVDCSVCITLHKVAKGGRPPKSHTYKKAASVPKPENQQNQCSNVSSALDMPLSELLCRATPSYVSNLELLPSRFSTQLETLICPICSLVVDRAVESKCCSTLFCAACVYAWHKCSQLCNGCSNPTLLSSYLQPHSGLRRILSQVHISCDNAGTCSLDGCTESITLSSLRGHVSQCTGYARSICPSTPVSDVLQAPDFMLQGDVSDRLLSKLISAKSEGSQVQQRTGGRPVVWERVTAARVSSEEASERTRRRRSSELDHLRHTVCGGLTGSFAQQSHDTRVMSRQSREALLKDAGILPKGTTPGIGLAIKADLQLPWYALRKLRRYMREFGVPLESEQCMRHQVKNSLPFQLLAQEIPLCSKTGSVTLCPVVCFENLVELVVHYIQLHADAGTLTWRDGSIPEDEVWVKVGGDHGGESFKLCFQIVNTASPNSLANTIPFLVFGAKDSPSNLQTTLEPYYAQFQQLSTTEWNGKRIRLTVFGDYEFLTKSYGLSGSSGRRPCLFCLSTKDEFQTPLTPEVQPRSLDQLKEDFDRFSGSGGALSTAKHYNNVIRPTIIPVELDNICMPVLHLDLGIFPWLYEAMIRDTDSLDLSIARSGQSITDSAEFNAIAEQQREFNEMMENLNQASAEAEATQTQLQWFVMQAQNATVGTADYSHYIARAGAMHQMWAVQQKRAAELPCSS